MSARKITKSLFAFSNADLTQDEMSMFIKSIILTAFLVLFRYQNGPFDDSKLLRHLP